jgi:hypothetical protein
VIVVPVASLLGWAGYFEQLGVLRVTRLCRLGGRSMMVLMLFHLTLT